MKTYRDLAKRIADRLFIGGNSEEAKRLALVISEGDTHQCAGWCKLAAIDQIEMVIEDHFTTKRHKKH